MDAGHLLQGSRAPRNADVESGSEPVCGPSLKRGIIHLASAVRAAQERPLAHNRVTARQDLIVRHFRLPQAASI
jgi:hypothetical protein